MSWFTPGNGPEAPLPPSTKDITTLIEQYRSVIEQLHTISEDLSAHVRAGPTDNVHKYAAAIETAVSIAVSTLTTRINSLATIEALETVSNKADSAYNLASAAATKDYVDTLATELNDNVLPALSELQRDYVAISEGKLDVAIFNNFIEQLGKAFAFKVSETLEFTTYRHVNIQHAGLIDSKHVFLLGMLAENWENSVSPDNKYKAKSGTIFIKYINDYPMDAILNVTATCKDNSYYGQMYGAISHNPTNWHDTHFVLIKGTNENSGTHVYIGIVSSQFSSSQSEYRFYIAGLNVIPVGSDGYKPLNGEVTNDNIIAKIDMLDDGGFSASNINVTSNLDYMTEAEAEDIFNAANM